MKMQEKLRQQKIRLRAWNIKRLSTPRIACKGSETVCCKNCGERFVGNYCPRCGQDATVRALRFMDIPIDLFGSFFCMDRGFFATMWQLFTRPGYLIRDFLQGKRTSYFRPFQCIFALAAFYVLVALLLNPDAMAGDAGIDMTEQALTENIAEEATKAEPSIAIEAAPSSVVEAEDTSDTGLLSNVLQMMRNLYNDSKAFKVVTSIFIMAMVCSLVFRKKVTGVRYSYVEHIFIQAYIRSQLLFLDVLFLPFNEVANVNFQFDVPWYLIIALYCYDYKQLYGMSWIATIYRTLLAQALFFVLVLIVMLGILLCFFHEAI